MTFKSVDLQMSVPRTQEFSGMQGQAMHRAIAEQSMLAKQSTKQTEELRSKNTEVDESASLHIRNDQESNEEDNNRRQNKKPTDNEAQEKQDHPSIHPYKGHHLDIKL